MPDSSTPTTEDGRLGESTWPWACLDCETPIYHDGEWCRDCAPAHQHVDTDRLTEQSMGFIEWMRNESLTAVGVKVAMIATIELLLTTFWLQQLLPQLSEIGTAFPFSL